VIADSAAPPRKKLTMYAVVSRLRASGASA
jgi:hypothetical protein